MLLAAVWSPPGESRFNFMIFYFFVQERLNVVNLGITSLVSIFKIFYKINNNNNDNKNNNE